jgi:hypothetical protein
MDALAKLCDPVKLCLTAENKICVRENERMYCGCLVRQGCYTGSSSGCDAPRRTYCDQATKVRTDPATIADVAILPTKLKGTSNAVTYAIQPYEPKTLKKVFRFTGTTVQAQGNPAPRVARDLVTLHERPVLGRALPAQATLGSVATKRTRGKALVTPRRESFLAKPSAIPGILGAPKPDPELEAWLGPTVGGPGYPDRNNQAYWPMRSCREYAYQRNFEYLWFKDQARLNAWSDRTSFKIATRKTPPGLNHALAAFGPGGWPNFQWNRATKIPWNIFATSAYTIVGDKSVDVKGHQPGYPKTDVFDRHALIEATYAQLPARPGPQGPLYDEDNRPLKGVSDGEFQDIAQRLTIHAQKIVQLNHILAHMTPYSCSKRPLLVCDKQFATCYCTDLADLRQKSPATTDFFGSDSGPVPDAGPYALALYAAEGGVMPGPAALGPWAAAFPVDNPASQPTSCSNLGPGAPTESGSTPAPPPDTPAGPIPSVAPDGQSTPPPSPSGQGGSYKPPPPNVGSLAQYKENCKKTSACPQQMPSYKTAAGYAGGKLCGVMSSTCAKLGVCYAWVMDHENAALQVLEDLKAGIAYEKSLGAHGCMHPDPNQNKCNWAYSAVARWATTAGDAAVEKDYQRCNRFAPDFDVLWDFAKQQAYFKPDKRALFPWCKSRTPPCTLGGCAPQEADKCSGNIYAPQSEVYVDYAASIPAVERFFYRRTYAKQDWARFIGMKKKQYVEKVVKPGIASVQNLPYGASIGQDVGDTWGRGDLFGAGANYRLTWRVAPTQSKEYPSSEVNHGNCATAADSNDVTKGCCGGSPCFDEAHICALEGALTASAGVDAKLLYQSIPLMAASVTMHVDGTQATGKYALKGTLATVLGVQVDVPESPIGESGLSFTQPIKDPKYLAAPLGLTFWVGPIPIVVKAGAVASAGLAVNGGGRGQNSCGSTAYQSVGFSIENQVVPYAKADAFAEGGVGFDIGGIVGASAGIRVVLNLVTLSVPLATRFDVGGDNGVNLYANAAAAIDALSGYVSLYAEVEFLFFSDSWEVELFSWNGFHLKHPIADWNHTFPMKALSWHYYLPTAP